MSFLLRKKEGKISPALQKKLDQMPTSNGHVKDKPGNDANDQAPSLSTSTSSAPSSDAPRVVIVGAGSRGSSYARAIKSSGLGIIIGVCDPVGFVRNAFGKKYIWGPTEQEPKPYEAFESWMDYIQYEQGRRAKVASREIK
jgi:hypothetical protein